MHASAFRTMEALHKVRVTQTASGEAASMRQDAKGECKCKNKKRVRLTKDEEEETRKYFTSKIVSKVKEKPFLFSCEEFLHDHPY